MAPPAGTGQPTTDQGDQAPRVRARRLTLWCTVRDRSDHRPLVVELLRRARAADLAGVTVFEAVAGYGTGRLLHRQHLLADEAPLAVVVVDEPEAVDRFLADLADLSTSVTSMVVDVDVVLV